MTIRVGVDSGVIQIARRESALEAGGDLYGKVQDLALWTARGVWDGKKGAIGTPTGDGMHEVKLRTMTDAEWNKFRKSGADYTFLINLPRREAGKGFTLYIGDVGRVDGQIDFPDHQLISFAWLDPGTLEFQVIVP